MRINEEIDALEVMGVPPVTFLCGSRLLGAWIALPFIYVVGTGVMYLASYIAVVKQVGDVSAGGYLLVFWMFQDPTDLLFSLIKGDQGEMATVTRWSAATTATPPRRLRVGTATAKSMAFNIVAVHIIGMVGTLVFWAPTRACRSAVKAGRPGAFAATRA